MKASEKIVLALTRVRKITRARRAHIIKSQEMSREDRELLVRTKWLQEIIKGWYLVTKPDYMPGDSAIWYANFWDFLRIYFTHHYADAYCLSAENSLDLHTASSIIPQQVICITKKGGGVPQGLPFNTSLYAYADPKNFPQEKTTVMGVHVMSLPLALCKVTPAYFQKNPSDATIALQLIRTSSELSQVILKYNFKSAAARLIGAYRHLGLDLIAEGLTQDLEQVGLKVKEENPFIAKSNFLMGRERSPYVTRIRCLWGDYRKQVIECFPKDRGIPKNKDKYFRSLQDLYEKDAYNSLSIEGYQVDEELILRVKNNQWNPDKELRDQNARNALAARGYYEAFLEVKKSLLSIFEGKAPGIVLERDLKKWYQSLFQPSVQAKIMGVEDLLGYRKGQVFIRNSRHIPVPKDAVVDCMEALFECLKNEEHAAVRAVLGHYFFVYIHPYMDGNGRIARFLMNAMFASGNYPWTIIQQKHRTQYLDALSVLDADRNVEPFARFISQEMQEKVDS